MGDAKAIVEGLLEKRRLAREILANFNYDNLELPPVTKKSPAASRKERRHRTPRPRPPFPIRPHTTPPNHHHHQIHTNGVGRGLREPPLCWRPDTARLAVAASGGVPCRSRNRSRSRSRKSRAGSRPQVTDGGVGRHRQGDSPLSRVPRGRRGEAARQARPDAARQARLSLATRYRALWQWQWR